MSAVWLGFVFKFRSSPGQLVVLRSGLDHAVFGGEREAILSYLAGQIRNRMDTAEK